MIFYFDIYKKAAGMRKTEYVGKIPNVREDVLWQASLQEDVLDLDAGNESVVVAVGLLEQRGVPETVAGVDDPRNGLDSARMR